MNRAARLLRGGMRALSTTTLPRLVEPHHHYVASTQAFHSQFAGMIPEYTPEQFVADSAGVTIDKAIHIEAAPADPLGEARWLESVLTDRRTPLVGIVAACDLSAADAPEQIEQLRAECPHVVGIRYVVDYAGPFSEAPATHPFVSRHGPGANGSLGAGKGLDFLRDEAIAPRFEAGYRALAAHDLTFDLQCAPEQLEAAAALIGRHPNTRVVLDHLGKPRLGGDAAADMAELATWRAGMAQLRAGGAPQLLRETLDARV